MNMKTRIVSILMFFCCFFVEAHGFELYSIVRPGCKSATGLIVHMDSDSISLLDTMGKLVTVSVKGIEHILVYNTLDNPISDIRLEGELAGLVRHVKVQGAESYSFSGWPIRFLENIIVFYDVEGNIHLVDVELISGFEIPDSEEIALIGTGDMSSKAYRFGYGSNLPECSLQGEESVDLVQPTRMISDQIKIAKFLRVYRNGFTKLDRFQKRTSFYARPYLYEKKTKVGILVDREEMREELPYQLPLNFQWPTGRNFGPQGILNLGSIVNPLLPNVEPVFGVHFSGKYHFLSVSFSGNGWAFSNGQDYIVKNRASFADFFSEKEPDEPFVFPHYNQLALTGLEWGPYSVSGGYYYPIIGIQANGIFREILSEQSMPAVNLKYTTHDVGFQLMFSDVNIKSDSPTDSSLKLIYAEEMAQGTILTEASKELIYQLDSFDLKSRMARFNFDLNIHEELTVGFSEVIMMGDYEEVISGEEFEFDYTHYITSLRAQQEFGDYVSLKGYLNYFIRQYQSKTTLNDEKTENNKFSFTVVVEFIL